MCKVFALSDRLKTYEQAEDNMIKCVKKAKSKAY